MHSIKTDTKKALFGIGLAVGLAVVILLPYKFIRRVFWESCGLDVTYVDLQVLYVIFLVVACKFVFRYLDKKTKE